jgi:hypothetical protein
MSDICRICGKTEVTPDIKIPLKLSSEERKLYRNDLCWRRTEGYCTDVMGESLDEVNFLCNQRDKLIEENKQLQLMLSTILGESIYVPKPNEMDRLEEAKAYVRGINALRRSSRPPL